MSNIPHRPKVQPTPCRCHVCGAGPVKPRIVVMESATEKVTQAEWVCPRCTSKFKIGEVERKEKKQG